MLLEPTEELDRHIHDFSRALSALQLQRENALRTVQAGMSGIDMRQVQQILHQITRAQQADVMPR